MMSLYKKWVFLALWLTVSFTASALGVSFSRDFPKLSLQNYRINQIKKIGSLTLFATDEGVAAYDGNIWQNLKLKNQKGASAIAPAREEGKIWVAGENEFGYLSVRPEGNFEYICIADSFPDKIKPGLIKSINESNDRIYLQGENIILILDAAKPDKPHPVFYRGKINSAILINDILFLATDKGAKRLDKNKIVKAFASSEIDDSKIVTINDISGNPIIISESNGIFTLEYGNIVRLPDFNDYSDIMSAAITQDYLAISSRGRGVSVTDRHTGLTQTYNQQNGLKSDNALCLEFDGSNNLWVGYDRGAEQLLLDFPIRSITNSRLSIGSPTVSKVYDNIFWMGTDSGLAWLSYPYHYPLRPENLPVPKDKIISLNNLGEDMMVATTKGLYQVSKAKEVKELEDSDGLTDIKEFYHNPDKAIATSPTGLFLFEKKADKWINTGKVKGFDGSVKSLFQENDSTFWIASDDGVHCLTINFNDLSVTGDKFFEKTWEGMSLKENIYISHVDGTPVFLTPQGIERYDANNKIIKRDIEFNKVADLTASPIDLIDFNDFIFILTPNEAVRINGRTGERKMVAVSDDWLLPTAGKMFQGKILNVADENSVIIPSVNGFFILEFDYPESKKSGLFAGANNINRITVDNDSIVYQSNFLNIVPEIKIQNGATVSIDFGNEWLADHKLVKYSYSLDGNQWSEPSNLTFKEYTNLKKGKHVFYLRTIFPDKTEENSISFTISPRWYETGWAISFYVVAAIFLIFIPVVLIYRKSLIERFDIMSQKEGEKLRQRLKHKEVERLKDEYISTLENEKEQIAMEHKAHSLTEKLVNEASKNEILIDVKDSLKQMSDTDGIDSSTRKNLISLHNKISEHLSEAVISESTKKDFLLIHDDFTEKLRTSFPNLSEKEILLCTYIKMNLTTKEIAPLMNISVRGLETMRYRIRKKILLDREENLNQWIEKFNKNI